MTKSHDIARLKLWFYYFQSPYVNHSAPTVQETFSLHRTYIIFRTLGLRYVVYKNHGRKMRERKKPRLLSVRHLTSGPGCSILDKSGLFKFINVGEIAIQWINISKTNYAIHLSGPSGSYSKGGKRIHRVR